MSTVSLSDYPKEGTEAAFSVLLKIAKILAGCTKGPEGYCIIGGWMPFFLCSTHAALGPHVGSMDVDVLLIPDKVRLQTMDALGHKLDKAGFEPEPGERFPTRTNWASAKWWFRNAAPRTDIRIDFMAPAANRATSLSETIAADLKILRYYGTNAATHEALLLKPGDIPGAVEGLGDVRLPVANGGAALMAKTIAYEARRHDEDRGKGSKDAYDLFYLLTSYRNGTERLISELLSNPESALRAEVLRILEADFTTPQATGTRLACDFLPDPPGGRDEFARQVSAQIGAFLQLVKDRLSGP